MKQRVCLACCLVSEPELIILDEPLNGLDADGVLWLQEFIRSHRNNGGAVLLSSHLMAEMQTVADSVVILDRGEVVARGAIESLAGDSRTEIICGRDSPIQSFIHSFFTWIFRMWLVGNKNKFRTFIERF